MASKHNAALLTLSQDRMSAYNVEPGDYEIICTGVTGEILSLDASVEKIDIVVVDHYEVTHASNDVARDGMIRRNLEFE